METCPKCRKPAYIRRFTQQLPDRNKCYRDPKNGRMVLVMKNSTIATCSQCGNTWTEQ